MNSFFLRQSSILMFDEIKQLFLRKRALFFIVAYVGFLLITFWSIAQTQEYAGKIITNVMQSSTQHDLQNIDQQFVENSLKSFTIPEKIKDENPILRYPWPLILYFLISISTLPFLIPTVSCDMISEDISRGTQRFLLFRVSRAAYFWSKTIAHLLVYIHLQALVFLILLAYCALQLPETLHGLTFTQCLNVNLRILPVLFCFVAYTQFFSGITNSPIKSLLVSNCMLFVMLILLAIEPRISLFYAPLWQGLFNFQWPATQVSLIGFSIWSMLFLLVGFAIFHKKKL